MAQHHYQQQPQKPVTPSEPVASEPEVKSVKNEPTLNISQQLDQPLATVVGAAMLIALQDRQNLPKSLEMMRLWYNAQPLDNRQETARAARALLEKSKLIAEALFREIVLVSSQDMNG